MSKTFGEKRDRDSLILLVPSFRAQLGRAVVIGLVCRHSWQNPGLTVA